MKHFEWEPRGKRRLHKRPLPSQIAACMPWLRMEIESERGRVLASSHAPFVLATLHPSALLRISEPDERREAFEHFVADLRLVHDAKRKAPP